MLKRLCLLFAALVLPAFLGTSGGTTQAAITPLPSDPTTADGWTGIPDLDRTSARFMSVSGDANFTLPGNLQLANNAMRLSFNADTLTQIRIATFDAGTKGRWDQRVDGVFVEHQPDTTFTVYADPDNTIAALLLAGQPVPAPLFVVSALDPSLVNEDETWCTLYDQPIGSAQHAAAFNATENRYNLLIVTSLKASPSGPLSGYEINGYKLAFNGTYAIPKGTVTGFTCGAVDGLELQAGEVLLVSNDPFPDILPLGANDGIVNSYDGTVELPFAAGSTCEDIEILEADADWNRALNDGETIDLTPTGVPPDSGIRYLNPQPPIGVRNAGAFAITGTMLQVPQPGVVGLADRFVGAIGYQVIKPNASTYTTDEFSILGHASITNAFDNGPDTPFVKTTVPFAELQANLGTWKFRWVGLDAHNSVFFKSNVDFGTTVRRVPVSGRVFCDEDGDLQYDVGEMLLDGLDITITRPGTPFNLVVKTDVNGVWKALLEAGAYEVNVTTPLCFQPEFGVPFPVTVTGCEDEIPLVFPYNCMSKASGTVFCDNEVNPGAFDALDEFFTLDATVLLERLEGLNVVETREIFVPAGTGLWSDATLKPGNYRASIKSDPLIDTLTKTTAQPILFTLDRTHCEVRDRNFGYGCAVELCGRLFCDKDGDCLFDPQGDEPLGGVTVTATLTVPGAPPTVLTLITDVNGEFCFKVAAGNWVIFVDPLQPALKGVTLISAPPNPIVVGPQGVKELLWCYECFGRISGTVYLNKPDCDGDFDLATDIPIADVEVLLWKLPAGPPALPFRQETTDANGFYVFEDLEEGSYVVRVGAGQPEVINFFATQPVQRDPVVMRGDSIDHQDFGYCEKARILGKVFRENGSQDCNGIYEVDDTPIAGVTVQLVGIAPVRPPVLDVTDANGDYDFPGLEPGSYEVRVNGGQPQLIVLAPGSALTVPVTLLAGDEVRVDFPFCPSSICGTVYRNGPGDCDEDYDLGFDAPLPGVIVNLWKSPAGPPALPFRSAVTDAAGGYCFKDLDAGTYRVQVGAGQVVLVNLTPTNPLVRNPVVLPGTEVLNQDFGYCQPGSIRGRVFRESDKDLNCDGVFNGTDKPISGVTVSLVGTNPVRPPAVRLTDANGMFEFLNLQAGEWLVSVDGGQPLLVNLAPGSAADVPATLLGGDEVVIDYPFCPGRICGTVYKNDPQDCDEDYDLGADVPLPGVVVNLWLAPAGPPALPVRTTVTDLAGGYCFVDLDGGTYRVQVAGGQPQLLNLTPTQPVVRDPVVLPGGEVLEQDFGYCEPLGRVFGYVYVNPSCTCDGTFDAIDTPLAGVPVALTWFVDDMGFFLETFTDGNGFYEFTGLPAGQYTVAVDGASPVVVDLSPSTPSSVGPFTLPAGGERRVDFGYCTQKVCGNVFREPPCQCDGRRGPSDLPAVGVLVQLLKLDAPNQGSVRETLTDDRGEYCFDPVAPGRYELSIPDGQGVLADLEPSTDTVRTITVVKGCCCFDLDFGFCTPDGQRLCATVFCESSCDGRFDAGVDLPMAFVEVAVVNAYRPDVVVATGLTDDAGRVCFEDLAVGSYVISVDPTQAAVGGYKPSTSKCLCVTLCPCEEEEVVFGFCRDCKPTPCCEGDLREVLVGTAFWVGDCVRDFSLTAKVYRGCTVGCTELDSVSRTWRDSFGLPAVGANEVLEVAAVKVYQGVAYVVLRLKADGAWFQDGVFGREPLKLKVTLNGCTFNACATYRCESFRPGQYFALGGGRLCVPSCDCCWRWDGRSAWSSPWICQPDCTSARFLVLDTQSQQEWECLQPLGGAVAAN